jgi:DNA-directed RNA polymerase subunit delta
MSQNITDAKTGADSSPAQDAKLGVASSTTKQGDNESSLTAALAVTAKTPGGEGETVSEDDTLKNEAVNGNVQKLNKTKAQDALEVDGEEAEPSTEDEEGEEEDGEEKDDTDAEGKEDDANEDKDEEGEEDTDKSKGQDARLDKHPRFQELNEKVKSLEPLAKQAKVINDFCSSHGISTQEMAQALDLVAMLKDPTKAQQAQQVLAPIWQGVNAVLGEVLPPDLQKAVDDQKVTIEFARELAKTRAQNVMGQQVSQQERARQAQVQLETQVTAWEKQKRASDPDFQTKFPMLVDSYEAALARNPTNDPRERIAILETVYKQVTDRVIAFRPKTKTKKVLPSTGSAKTKVEPKSSLDAAMAAASKHGTA